MASAAVGLALLGPEEVSTPQQAAALANQYLRVLAPKTTVKASDCKSSDTFFGNWIVRIEVKPSVRGQNRGEIHLEKETGALCSWRDPKFLPVQPEAAQPKSKWKVTTEKQAYAIADTWLKFAHMNTRPWKKVPFSNKDPRVVAGIEKDQPNRMRLEYVERIPGVIGEVNHIRFDIDVVSGKPLFWIGSTVCRYVPPKSIMPATKAVKICRPYIEREYQRIVVQNHDSYYSKILKWPGDSVVLKSAKKWLGQRMVDKGRSVFDPQASHHMTTRQDRRLCWILGVRGWSVSIDVETGEPLEYFLIG